MLISPSSLLLFATGAAILLIIPGPAILYIVNTSIAHGRSAGLVSVLGVVGGALIHVVAATVGLSAILASSVLAFQCVKYAGAAYVIYLGIRTLRSGDTPLRDAANGDKNLWHIFSQGVLVNLLNPKTVLFFLAFLPQFVNPARGHAALQILQLGLLFAVMSWIADSGWAALASIIGARLRASLRPHRAQRNISGGILVAVGLVALLAAARTK
jgi:threonine/homoserine/homoserine lactone efflux protein